MPPPKEFDRIEETEAQRRGVIECYITDRRTLAGGESLISALSRNLAAGPNWIQIREKDLPGRELYELVQRTRELPNPRGVEILVNSRVDVALAAGAAGAHLPAGAPPPKFWRRLTPVGFRIGVSCHSVDEVREAEQEGADYAFFGPVFDPISKESARPALGLGALSRAAMAVRIPVLALGGITSDNKRACISAGAAGVAGISIYQIAKATC
ncbi:MAG TPA: thiamine phosphate synthase [Bryobacteraceae bacterium]|nr:thiamine phosphate synthase [Bryobacteraceae bacterium]